MAAAASVAVSGSQTPDLLTQLQNLLALATRASGKPYGAIHLITDGERRQILAAGSESTGCPLEGGSGTARFHASVPLMSDSDVLLGSLCVWSPVPGRLAADKRATLEIIASQTVAVLELQKRARVLATSLADAQRSNDLLSSFAGRVSHELLNPLSSIIGFSELGEELVEELGSSAARDFATIGRTSRRMLGRVHDMLSFARIGGDIRPEPVSLASLVHDVEEDLAHSLTAVDAKITVTDLQFQADPEQLRTFLQNLIHNAVAYRRADTALRIRVTADVGPDELIISVADNGKGIPAEDREHVIEPLTRLHRDGDPPGSGLGLATCVRIAGAHGGRLEIGEGSDGGTMVSLRMPLRIPTTAGERVSTFSSMG